MQRVRVQLPGTPELLTKFREKKVDFAAHTQDRRTAAARSWACWVSGREVELAGSGFRVKSGWT